MLAGGMKARTTPPQALKRGIWAMFGVDGLEHSHHAFVSAPLPMVPARMWLTRPLVVLAAAIVAWMAQCTEMSPSTQSSSFGSSDRPGVLLLTAADEASVTQTGRHPIVVKVDLPGCGQCGELDPFWKMVGEALPHGSVWHVDCDAAGSEGVSLCHHRADQQAPRFEAWVGSAGWQTYNGRRDLQDLQRWISAIMASPPSSASSFRSPNGGGDDSDGDGGEDDNNEDDSVNGVDGQIPPLIKASAAGRLDKVRRLVETGRVKDIDETAASSYSASSLGDVETTALVAAAYNGHASVVDYLLRAGASVSPPLLSTAPSSAAADSRRRHRDHSIWAPLSIAKAEGHFADVSKLLIDAGAVLELPQMPDHDDNEGESGEGANRNDDDDDNGNESEDDKDQDRIGSAGSEQGRPKVVHLTFSSRSDVPAKVWAQLRRFAGDHKVEFYDDDDCLQYIEEHFPDLLDKYLDLHMPPHRADMFRYAVMLREGGIYLDIKTVLVRPISHVFPDQQKLYSVLSKNGGAVHQGILAAPPRHPIFSQLLQRMKETEPFNVASPFQSDWPKDLYHTFTRQFHDAVAAMATGTEGEREGVVLFQERCFDMGQGGCVRGDRYGDCCTVRDDAATTGQRKRNGGMGVGRLLFLTRFQDFRLDKSNEYLKTAEMLTSSGRAADALTALYRAVDAHQGNWEAWVRWALALLSAGDKSKAEWALMQCASYTLPGDPKRESLVQRLRQNGFLEHAVALERSFAASPPSGSAGGAPRGDVGENEEVGNSRRVSESTGGRGGGTIAQPGRFLARSTLKRKTEGDEGGEGLRDAYVTLVSTPSYVEGALALGASIITHEAARLKAAGRRRGEDNSKRAMVALVTRGKRMKAAARALTAIGYEVMRVKGIPCTPRAKAQRVGVAASSKARFETACTKLHIFNLTMFRTVLYIDADALVLRESVTHLFDLRSHLTRRQPLAAAHEAIAPTLFNTGVLLVLPDAERFSELKAGVERGEAAASYDGADQGYLNGVFPDWWTWSKHHRLSTSFNFAQMIAYVHPEALRHYENDADGIAILHFLGSDKPWHSPEERGRPISPNMLPYFEEWTRFARLAAAAAAANVNSGDEYISSAVSGSGKSRQDAEPACESDDAQKTTCEAV